MSHSFYNVSQWEKVVLAPTASSDFVINRGGGRAPIGHYIKSTQELCACSMGHMVILNPGTCLSSCTAEKMIG